MTYSKCVCSRTQRRLQAGSVYTRLCIFTALLSFIFLVGFPAKSFATSLTASWNPNPEPNVAGYQLMYGTASGAYTTVIDVGDATSYSFSVTGGVTYYFVLQAYNTAGVYSPYSAEVSLMVPLPGGSGGGSGGSGGGVGNQLPFSGTPAPVPGQIDAANFDNGGEGVSY